MDRSKWIVLLAEAPPRDVRSAEEFGGLLVEWAYDRLRGWYRARFQRDLALREELDEAVGQFLTSVARRNFGCLQDVPVEKREAYLWKSLQRCVARHFAGENQRRERVFLLADCLVGEQGEERELDADTFAATDPTPEEQAMWKALWGEVLAETLKMSQPRQAVFHDRHEQGLTARGTAEHLHMPLGTVQWHDQQIFLTLKRHFESEH